MSRNSSINQRVVRACGTIFYKGDCTLDELNKNMLKYCNNEQIIMHYYFINHDDDVDKPHLHYLFVFDSQVRLSTLLNRLEVVTGLPRDNISVEKCLDFNSYLRYMLHIGEDKKQYAVVDIVSDEGVDTLQKYIASDDITLNIRRLFQLIMKYDDEVDLMYHLDLPIYHKYRHEIKTLYERKFYLLGHYKFLDREDNANNLPF